MQSTLPHIPHWYPSCRQDNKSLYGLHRITHHLPPHFFPTTCRLLHLLKTENFTTTANNKSDKTNSRYTPTATQNSFENSDPTSIFVPKPSHRLIIAFTYISGIPFFPSIHCITPLGTPPKAIFKSTKYKYNSLSLSLHSSHTLLTVKTTFVFRLSSTKPNWISSTNASIPLSNTLSTIFI